MHFDPTIQHMVAANRRAETLAKAERARLVAEARTHRPSIIIRLRQITGITLIRAGERLQGAHRTASEQTAQSVQSVDALRIAR